MASQLQFFNPNLELWLGSLLTQHHPRRLQPLRSAQLSSAIGKYAEKLSYTYSSIFPFLYSILHFVFLIRKHFRFQRKILFIWSLREFSRLSYIFWAFYCSSLIYQSKTLHSHLLPSHADTLEVCVCTLITALMPNNNTDKKGVFLSTSNQRFTKLSALHFAWHGESRLRGTGGNAALTTLFELFLYFHTLSSIML